MNHTKDRHQRSQFPANITVDNLEAPPEEALNVDLKEVVIPGVYPDKLNGDIKKIVEIGPNKVLNGVGSHHRSLLLLLSDGHATHKALEVGEIPGISLNTRPGTKVILFGPKLKIVGNSFMYLDSSMARVVGGGISELNAKWEMTKSLENRCRDNTSREGGPPAWAPFGEKINKDSLKVTKASAPVKDEKKNPTFDLQRKDAILTATRSSHPKKTNVEEKMKSEKNGKNYRDQFQRQNHNKAETGSLSQLGRKSAPSKHTTVNSRSSDKDPNDCPSRSQSNNNNSYQYRKISPKHSAPKEPIKIAQKEQPVQPKHDPMEEVAQMKSSFHESSPPISSFHEQFLQPPPNFTNCHQETVQSNPKGFSKSSYPKNQSNITTSLDAVTDSATFPIPSQSFTASSFSNNLSNQSFNQNDYYIQNSVSLSAKNEFDYTSLPLSSQSVVPFPNSQYASDVNHIQNYGNPSYFEPSLQPPLPTLKKNDFAENCIPSQALVFSSSSFSDGRTQNSIPRYIPSSYNPMKGPYGRTQFSEPPPNTFNSHTYRSNTVDGSLQNWIPHVETENEIQPYLYMKTNYNVVPSQSPPVQLEYDNQTQVYGRSNFCGTNNDSQKRQNECAPSYQINTNNSNESLQYRARKFDDNTVPQPYTYNRGSHFSEGAFHRKNNDEAHRGSQRQYIRPLSKPNQQPRAPNMRGARGRGFSHPRQPRFSSPTSQPGVLSEYFDTKLHINTG
ncbi:uncharacterized protein [Bemisia tabaci]|uniref:uncharacterized protein isoform X2 n=1 Tax=Bemisia tabaci TaxID=7038 RepID=UPI003B27CB01